MFRSVKRRLILTNTAVTAVIVLAMNLVTFIVMEKTMFHMVALSGPANGGPWGHRPEPVLLLISLAALALSYWGSSYMAGRALVPISRAWQRQKDFVADASHELRSPLAVIKTNLEIVMAEPSEKISGQERWLANIKHEADHMARLLDDLLFLARADSDQLQLRIEKFSLTAAVAEAAVPFEPLAAQNGLTLTLELAPDIIFHGDRGRLKQLVIILLDNALKFTPQGGRVRVELKRAGGIELVVADTGQGFPRADSLGGGFIR